MPLKNVRYRVKTINGKKVRLAFIGDDMKRFNYNTTKRLQRLIEKKRLITDKIRD
ncbi:MAG TPA: hypothetical protein VGE97_05290 [Nitrososphaera sp.]